ncbi:MAG: hypothetical protein ACP5T3_01115 [Candidatus Micrarchaeia archaeon]
MRLKIATGKLSAIASALANYPGMVQVGTGTMLKYELRPDSQNPDHFYVLEITRNSMALFTFSKSSPVYFMQEALLRLVSVLSLLDGVCTAELSGIYPYLISVLARQQLAYAEERAIDVRKPHDDLALLLSSRIKALLEENYALKRSGSESSQALSRVTAMLIVSRSSGLASVSELARITGQSREQILLAMAELPKLGYRAAYKNRDEFELVGL